MLVARLIFVLALGTLLAGCGGNEEKGTGNNTSNVAAQPVEEASVAEPAPGVAGAAAVEIDEASIRASLAHLTGASPAPLARGAITIAERGSEHRQ